jgi:hypothetical protein
MAGAANDTRRFCRRIEESIEKKLSMLGAALKNP